MLVLSRNTDQSVVVGSHEGFEPILKVTVLAINGGSVSLGFEASQDFPVHRLEVWEQIRASGQQAAPVGVAGQTEASRALIEKVHEGRMCH
jgi:carbon storage regulator CsrA